jgi:hypothetical protein
MLDLRLKNAQFQPREGEFRIDAWSPNHWLLLKERSIKLNQAFPSCGFGQRHRDLL